MMAGGRRVWVLRTSLLVVLAVVSLQKSDAFYTKHIQETPALFSDLEDFPLSQETQGSDVSHDGRDLVAAGTYQRRKQRGTKNTLHSGLLDRQGRAPKRGHHVINNNVLKLFKTFIDRFLAKNNLSPFQKLEPLLENTAVYKAYHRPMSDADTEAISKTMVYHGEIAGPDINAELYGQEVRLLSEFVVNYMTSIMSKKPTHTIERNIVDMVDDMNRHQYYVDERALNKWKGQQGDMKLYQEVKQNVAEMLSRLKYHNGQEVSQWTTELLRAETQLKC